MIDRGELPAVRVGSRRVRVRRSDLDRFLDAGATDKRPEPEPAEVDEGSITAWATFGAAMAEATATLQSPDRSELLDVLERLADATQALVDSLSGDAGSQPPEPAPPSGSPRLGAVRDALREHDAQGEGGV